MFRNLKLFYMWFMCALGVGWLGGAEGLSLAKVYAHAAVTGSVTVKAADQAKGDEGVLIPFVLGPGDVLQLAVWGFDDLSATATVRSDGMATFPWVGDVKVAGLTPEQTRAALQNALAAYVKNPQVYLAVVLPAKVRVHVLGEVRTPGAVDLERGARLADAISQAGGLTKEANAGRVKITRPLVSGGSHVFEVPLADYLQSGDPNGNPPLSPGDVVQIEKRALAIDWGRVVTVLTGLKVARDLLSGQ